jgi:ubiquinone/menaquinone biosynthesis C-methylase UbiE
MPSPLTFDQAAAAYDQYMGRWSRLFVSSLIEGVQLSPGEHVLDVAAGTGEATLACERAVRSAGVVVATDISVPMLTMARRKAGGALRIVASAGQALPFRAGSFDVIACVLGLMFFPDPVAGLREFRRVLRPGGRVALSVWPRIDQVSLVNIFVEALAAHLPDERRAIEQAFSLADEAQLSTLLQTAGFTEHAIRSERRRLTFESFDDYWGPIEAGGSRASVPYRALPAQVQDEIRGDVRRRLRPFEADGRFAMDVTMLLATARR